MPSATEQVFRLYELLELILLHLPIHDLFQIQRVSKSWRWLIQRSTALQQTMFLQPSDTPQQPLDTEYCHWAGRTYAIYPPAPIRLCPAADVQGLLYAPCGRRDPIATFGVSDQNVFLQFDVKGLPVYEKRIAHRDASWRHLLLTQPPVTAVNLEFIRREQHGGPVTVHSRTGLTIGDLHDWSLRLAEEYEIETGLDPEVSFERMTFCLMHPHAGDHMEEAW